MPTQCHDKEECAECDELTRAAVPNQLSLHREHALRLPRQRHPLPRARPDGRRRPEVPHRQSCL